MTTPDLQAVAKSILLLAENNGFVVPRDVRNELKAVGLPETDWKKIIEYLRESLNYRQGRYYFIKPSSPRLVKQKSSQDAIRSAVESLMENTSVLPVDNNRRQETRHNFPFPIQAQSEDGENFTVLGRDLSSTGIRIVSGKSLLGRKLVLCLKNSTNHFDREISLLTRIVWTESVGDGLYENGGTFLDVETAPLDE